MKTKVPTTDFPNKKLLKGRDQYQKLSKSKSGNQKGHQIFGIIGVVLFSGIFIMLIYELPLILKTLPIFILIGIVILLFTNLINYSVKEKIILDDTLYFDPSGNAQFRSINLIKGILVISSFLFSFFFIISDGGEKIIAVVIGGVFIAIVYSAFIYEATKIYTLKKQGKKFGPSKLTILKSATIHLGDNIELQVHNEFLPKHLQDVNIVLKNIQEVWEWKWKRGPVNNEKMLFTYLLYEAMQKIKVESNTLVFNFDLPTSEVAATNYSLTAPYYWELEISNKKENYHCIFFLEVKA